MRKIIPFGTSGWMPTINRQTMCMAYEDSTSLIFFDIGTGISLLASQTGQKLLKRHHTIIILISHYHMDHIAGLLYLPRFLRDKRVIIAGPGKGIYKESTETILSNLSSSPFFATSFTQYPMNLSFFDVAIGRNTVNKLTFHAQLQDHSDPTLGYRINDIVYLTDTIPSLSSFEFIKGSNILIHESMLDKRDFNNALHDWQTKEKPIIHSNADSVAELAKLAEVDKLILTHFNPSYSEQRLKNMLSEAKSKFSSTILAKELEEINIDE